MKLLITGKNGQIGSELEKALNKSLFEAIFLGRDELDICDKNHTVDVINNIKPEIIVNLAAFTDVKSSEKKIDKCFKVNSEAVLNIAKICKKKSILLIHISTDYVFDGKKDGLYTENDFTNPLNVYGKSKLQGEKNIINTLEKFIIIRTSWVFSSFGKNFLKTIIQSIKENTKLVVVGDQVGGPTAAKNVAKIIFLFCNKYKLENKLEYGIYNYSNLPNVSWFEFAKEIVNKLKINDHLNLKKNLVLERSKTIDTEIIQRPLNSKLSNLKIKKYLEIGEDYWTLSLDESLIELNKKIFHDE